jgi:hypothetical protein
VWNRAVWIRTVWTNAFCHFFLLQRRPTIGLISGTPCAKRHSPAIEQPWTSRRMLP